MVRALKLLFVAAAAVLVTSCGNGSDDTTGTTSEEPTALSSVSSSPTVTVSEAPLPRCAQVWVEGSTLSEEYVGCREDGQTVAISLRCETGQELFTFAGRMFAIPGGEIFAVSGALADDDRYQRIYRSCTA